MKSNSGLSSVLVLCAVLAPAASLRADNPGLRRWEEQRPPPPRMDSTLSNYRPTTLFDRPTPASPPGLGAPMQMGRFERAVSGALSMTYPQSDTLRRLDPPWSGAFSQPWDAARALDRREFFQFEPTKAHDWYDLGKASWDMARPLFSREAHGFLSPATDFLMATKPSIPVLPSMHELWSAGRTTAGIYETMSAAGRLPGSYLLGVGTSLWDLAHLPANEPLLAVSSFHSGMRSLAPMLAPQMMLLESLQHKQFDLIYTGMDLTDRKLNQSFQDMNRQFAIGRPSFSTVPSPMATPFLQPTQISDQTRQFLDRWNASNQPAAQRVQEYLQRPQFSMPQMQNLIQSQQHGLQQMQNYLGNQTGVQQMQEYLQHFSQLQQTIQAQQWQDTLRRQQEESRRALERMNRRW